MENRSHALLAGLFTLLLVIAAAIGAVWVSKKNIPLLPYELVATSPVTGLSVQSAVRYQGVPVGRVQSLRFMRMTGLQGQTIPFSGNPAIMQAMPPFMSVVPRPYSVPLMISPAKGGEVHAPASPVGTTSVWPANIRQGLPVPMRA